MSKKIMVLIITALVSSIILGACGANQPVEPTIDPNMLYTMAAQTVVVQLTEAAAKLPTSTPTPEATSTPPPIPTIEIQPTTPPLDAATQPADPGGQPVDPNAPTEPPAPTERPAAAEPTKPPIISGDHAYYGQTSPRDGTSFNPGTKFHLGFTIHNNGTTTWTTGYTWVFIGGNQLSGVSSVTLKNPVPPGKGTELFLDVTAPNDFGKYISRWRLNSSTGAPVPGSEVYFAFKVE